MPPSVSKYANLNDWIAREAIPFSADRPETIDAAVDRVAASLDPTLALLGFGEPLHSGEEILLLRNRLFERLVTNHGFSAIAIESSFPRGRLVDEFVAGGGPASYEDVRDAGFGNGFGRLEANRDLVQWMRCYNAGPANREKVRFYGFDIPIVAAAGTASPRGTVQFMLDHLAAVDANGADECRKRVETLVGDDAAWENTAVYTDPSKAVGRSPAAISLRVEVEELISELHTRGPDLIAATGRERHLEALHFGLVARQLLGFHAGIARQARFAALLGIRDVSMADNLAYIAERERDRGKVLTFAHNSHLKRGKMVASDSWRKALGTEAFEWWPAGAHLHHRLGDRYVVIGSGLAASEANGIAPAEPGSLEHRLTASGERAVLIPTHRGVGLPQGDVEGLSLRSESAKNLSYTPLGPQSLTDFDWLVLLPLTAYARGGWPLPGS